MRGNRPFHCPETEGIRRHATAPHASLLAFHCPETEGMRRHYAVMEEDGQIFLRPETEGIRQLGRAAIS